MRILISFGTTSGSAGQRADVLAATLRAAGHDVDVVDADAVRHVVGYGAVIVGGEIRRGQWQYAARHLVRRHASDLARVPVWFCSFGAPGLASATPRSSLDRAPPVEGAGAPFASVRTLMDLVGAQGHASFSEGKDGADGDALSAWARRIARALPGAMPGPVIAPRPPRLRFAVLAALDLFVSAGALSGGAALIARPDGSLLQLSPALLEHSPFASYLIPGLTLFVLIGLGHLAAGVLSLRRHPAGPLASLAAAAALLGWLGIEVALLRTITGLQLLYLALALATAAASRALGAGRPAASPPAPPDFGSGTLEASSGN